MTLRSDLKTLYHIIWKRARGADHATRMEDFYGRQAVGYDDFREKMLRGRQEFTTCSQRPTMACGSKWAAERAETSNSSAIASESFAKSISWTCRHRC